MKFDTKKRNKFFVLIILTLTIFCFGLNINDTLCADKTIMQMKDELTDHVEDTIDDIDFNEIQSIVDNFDENQKKMFSVTNVKTKLKEVLSGEGKIDYQSILGGILSVLFQIICQCLQYL